MVLNNNPPGGSLKGPIDLIFDGVCVPDVLPQGQFHQGQVVRHRRAGWRALVVAGDPGCTAGEAWYGANQDRGPRDQPWYHLLVEGAEGAGYAAEQDLEAELLPGPIRHPLVYMYFATWGEGYRRNGRPWKRLQG